MNIHVISQRSHWSTNIYAARCRPISDDVVRQNVVLIEPSSTSTAVTLRQRTLSYGRLCDQCRLKNVFNYSDVVRPRCLNGSLSAEAMCHL